LAFAGFLGFAFALTGFLEVALAFTGFLAAGFFTGFFSGLVPVVGMGVI
jgi:hypothetical protein